MVEQSMLVALRGAEAVAEKIAQQLGQTLAATHFQRFSDGELLVKAKPSLRGRTVFLIQATCPPVNDNLMELLIMIQAVRMASAQKINVVLTYYGYARQDRKCKEHEPITSKLVAHLLTAAGADRVLLVDIHSPITIGFFNIPVDNIRLFPLVCRQIIDLITHCGFQKPIALVSPDYGGLVRVRGVAELLQTLQPHIAFIDKHRTQPNSSEVVSVLGDVRGRICFLIDDMIDTAGSIVNAAQAVRARGALNIYVLATHGLFSGMARQRLTQAIKNGLIEQVIVFDTVAQTSTFPGLKVINCGNWIAKFINCLIRHQSFSAVYEVAKTNIRQLVAQLQR